MYYFHLLNSNKVLKNNTNYNLLKLIALINGIFLLISILAPLLKPTLFQVFSVIALFFPLLWIINVLLLLILIIMRSRLAIISLLLLLLGVYQVSLIYNISSIGNPNRETNGLRIISYNTGNADTINPIKSRKETFKDKLFLASDIVCLQEFTPNNDIGIDVLEKFNNKINVDYYGVVGGDSSGLSIYSNYEIVDFGFLKQEMEDSYALWCYININNDTITLINVQLQSIRLEENELESMTSFAQISNLPGNLFSIYSKLERGFRWREEQVENLTSLITNSSYPVVLCGDFNDPPSSYSYREISNLLVDAFLEKGSGLGTTYAGKLPFLRIDYIMVSEGYNVMDYQRIRVTHSDHYPVWVEVEN